MMSIAASVQRCWSSCNWLSWAGLDGFKPAWNQTVSAVNLLEQSPVILSGLDAMHVLLAAHAQWSELPPSSYMIADYAASPLPNFRM